MHVYINSKCLIVDHYKVKCVVGKRGIGKKLKEGDKITPKGKFKVKYILYRKDRISSISTKIPKFIIRKNMGWCDDPNSKYYNKLIKFPFIPSAEKLYIKKNIYDIILVINYNLNPIVKNKGSAIFIHIATKKYKPTQGCIAVNKKDLKKIIRKINKKTIIEIN